MVGPRAARKALKTVGVEGEVGCWVEFRERGAREVRFYADFTTLLL